MEYGWYAAGLCFFAFVITLKILSKKNRLIACLDSRIEKLNIEIIYHIRKNKTPNKYSPKIANLQTKRTKRVKNAK